MKNNITFIVTAIILFVSVFLSANFQLKEEELMSTQKEVTSVSNCYLLKNYNGHIAVFREENEPPIITTDTLVNTLPKNDQTDLEKGVVIKDDTSLRKALEDYCS